MCCVNPYPGIKVAVFYFHMNHFCSMCVCKLIISVTAWINMDISNNEKIPLKLPGK
jgi:hypothetical protein